MGFVRKIAPLMLGVVLPFGGEAVAAGPPEQLVVTQLADPDPNYVPPPEPRRGLRHEAPEDDSLDQALEQFGQALGQAIQSQQQMMLQRCKERAGAAGTGRDRMAWEAACKYTRR